MDDKWFKVDLGQDVAHPARSDDPGAMGEPVLMWSLTGDGQDDPRVIAARDKEFGFTTADIRKQRTEAIG